MPISLELHAESVTRALARKGVVNFSELLGGQSTPELVVVTMLAILEIYRRGRADLEQEELFGDIVVTKREPQTGPAPSETRES
jgi:segregation and condensation protein A